MIKDEIIKDVISQFEIKHKGVHTEEQHSKCIRDTGFNFDAIVADLKAGGIKNIEEVAQRYWAGAVSNLGAGEQNYAIEVNKLLEQRLLKEDVDKVKVSLLIGIMNETVQYGYKAVDQQTQDLKNAVDITQRAQRNYDLSKSIPQADLDTLIYTAINSPSKQNETHFKLKVYTDPNLIRNIYDCTKRFSLFTEEVFDKMFKDTAEGVKANATYEIKNSQILANVVFVYCDDEDNLRGGEHIIANKGNASEETRNFFTRLKNFSIGISSGQLSLVAALLGYKTGFCAAYSTSQLKAVIKDEPRLLVGIGYENSNMDRRLHGTLFNRDIPKQYRTGKDDERFRFNSFDKKIKIEINNERRN